MMLTNKYTNIAYCTISVNNSELENVRIEFEVPNFDNNEIYAICKPDEKQLKVLCNANYIAIKGIITEGIFKDSVIIINEAFEDKLINPKSKSDMYQIKYTLMDLRI